MGEAVQRDSGADCVALRVLGFSDLTWLISEFCPSSAALDATCRQVKEARKQVVRYSLSKKGTMRFLGDAGMRSRILSRVIGGKEQLIGQFTLLAKKSALESLRGRAEEFASFKLEIDRCETFDFKLNFANLRDLRLYEVAIFDPDVLKCAVNLESLTFEHTEELKLNFANLKKLKCLELLTIYNYVKPDEDKRGSASVETFMLIDHCAGVELDFEMLFGSMHRVRELSIYVPDGYLSGRIDQVFPGVKEVALIVNEPKMFQSLGGCPDLERFRTLGKYLPFLPALNIRSLEIKIYKDAMGNIGTTTAHRRLILPNLKFLKVVVFAGKCADKNLRAFFKFLTTVNVSSMKLDWSSATPAEFEKYVVEYLKSMEGLRNLYLQIDRLDCSKLLPLPNIEKLHCSRTALENLPTLLTSPNLKTVNLDTSCSVVLSELECFRNSGLFISSAKHKT